MTQWTFGLDGNSTETLARLAGLNARLEIGINQATETVAQAVLAEIPAQMNWKSPRPVLSGSFQMTGSNAHYEVGSAEPHARRREFGFSGRTDSRGRYFGNDPGALYMQAAISKVGDTVEAVFVSQVGDSLNP